jgi:hypothetical protein
MGQDSAGASPIPMSSLEYTYLALELHRQLLYPGFSMYLNFDQTASGGPGINHQTERDSKGGNP